MKPFIYNLDYVKEQSEKDLFKVVSFFAGGGGSSTGYRLAGGKVLAINEFVEAAQNVYAKNYPETHIFKGDIRSLTGQEVLDKIGMKKGELDILDGSPPCASFSMAGNREKDWGKVKKYSDKSQQTDDLFFQFARIIKDVQPKVFIAENVKGLTMGAACDLLGSEQFGLFGQEENTIFHALADAGYNLRYKVLSSKNYQVPQARERTIFIGVRKDIQKKISFPNGSEDFVTVESAFENLPENHIEEKCWNPDGFMLKDLWPDVKEGESFEIAYEKKYGKRGWFSRIKLDRSKPSNTITTHYEDLQHYEDNRKLSIAETIRLSSFPEDYYLGESYNKQYERLGRAVPPLMMSAIAKHVYETILK